LFQFIYLLTYNKISQICYKCFICYKGKNCKPNYFITRNETLGGMLRREAFSKDASYRKYLKMTEMYAINGTIWIICFTRFNNSFHKERENRLFIQNNFYIFII